MLSHSSRAALFEKRPSLRAYSRCAYRYVKRAPPNRMNDRRGLSQNPLVRTAISYMEASHLSTVPGTSPKDRRTVS